MIGQLSSATSSTTLQDILRRYSYGSIMLFCILVLWWGVEGPYPIEVVSAALQVTMVLTVASLEILIPFTRKWGDIRNVSKTDVAYFMLAAPIDQLQILLLVGLLAQTAPYHHYIQVFDFWPKQSPLLVQVLLATFAVDFFKYWYHRWTHEVPLLWRFHSIHHSLNRLEMLRASFFYPFDIFLTVALGTLAMLLFGVGYEVIIFHNVFAGITGLLNHSNADFHCGFFDRILNSPGHHRAHHSASLPGCHSNYGSFFNFTDRMFGTRFLPEDQLSVEPLGLDASYEMPKGFFRHLAVPFRWNQVHRQP